MTWYRLSIAAAVVATFFLALLAALGIIVLVTSFLVWHWLLPSMGFVRVYAFLDLLLCFWLVGSEWDTIKKHSV